MRATADQFLESVRKSQLVEAAQLASFLDAKSPGPSESPSPERLAEALIGEGLLTHFQARQLLQSRWQGFLLGGKYRILELLGSGGMGNVFLCEHLRLRTPVAVKILPAEKTADSSALDRFQREARAAASLSHPNLVRAFDIDEDGGFHFIVMEYVRGHSLQRLVQERGPFGVARAVECVRQAALGLQHAHGQGLVHRDVKPGNLLLDHQGVIKILDMGLVRFFHDAHDKLTEEYNGGSILGTADYLAPEQALDSHRATIQADIYSLGATFYFLLAGRAPFEDGSIPQKMIWHQVRQPPPLRDRRADVPPELEAVLLRMMAKDPADRYALPVDVARAVEPWAQPLPPPGEDELPPLCPLVQRLLTQTSFPVAPLPRPPSDSGSNTPLPAPSLAGGLLAPPPHARFGVSDDATPAPAREKSSGLNSLPRRSPSRRRLPIAGAVLFASGLVLGIYWLNRVLFPPPAGPGRPPELQHFDPLAGIDPNKVIPDYLAVGQVGQTRTVRMTVRDRERDDDGTIFFYSNLIKGSKEKKVFCLSLNRDAQQKCQAAGIASPYSFFMGQTVDVKGTVKYLTEGFNRPGIEVAEPGQIQLVNPE
jgi:serine/threonine protein kinase